MTVQTDADNTIYKGNLLVSLGWRYLYFLFKKRKYIQLVDRIIKLPIFYFLSYVPRYIYTAFLPFEGCPIELIYEIKNPLKANWLYTIKKLRPDKIVVISHQAKIILEGFIQNNPELQKYNFEIISNIAFLKEGKFTGKSEIVINHHTKLKYINKNQVFLGDLKDYSLYGKRPKKFILIK